MIQKNSILNEIEFTEEIGNFSDFNITEKLNSAEQLNKILNRYKQADLYFNNNYIKSGKSIVHTDIFFDFKNLKISYSLFNDIPDLVCTLFNFNLLNIKTKSNIDLFKEFIRNNYESQFCSLNEVTNSMFGLYKFWEKQINWGDSGNNDYVLSSFDINVLKSILKDSANKPIYLEEFFNRTNHNEKLPQSVFAFSVNIYSNEENSQYSNLFFRYAGGANASSIIGRFAKTSESNKNLVIQLAGLESDCFKDFIIADVLHVNSLNNGNLLNNTRTSQYVINCFGVHYSNKKVLRHLLWVIKFKST